jgi:hypothetical protein
MKIESTVLNRFVKWQTAALAVLAIAALASTPALAGEAGDNDNDGDDVKFDLVPSKGLPAAALNGALIKERPWPSKNRIRRSSRNNGRQSVGPAPQHRL